MRTVSQNTEFIDSLIEENLRYKNVPSCLHATSRYILRHLAIQYTTSKNYLTTKPSLSWIQKLLQNNAVNLIIDLMNSITEKVLNDYMWGLLSILPMGEN